MNAVTILGYGAVGLGFLLALLAYRLLAAGLARPGSIYIYMIFCVVLVLIGAYLQFVASNDRIEAAKLRDELVLAKSKFSGILSILEGTRTPLQQVLAHVTDGGVCPGGRSGVPLPGAGEDAARLSGAQQAISQAMTTAR